ncbi:hypothetical protein ACIFQM_19400 [Paenibacillus sp. NRS-1782]|uniref:hypothetical protein n=1 Tax=unclassified Paenibacillus TaxID=185978 RepID=UPI003D28EF1C
MDINTVNATLKSLVTEYKMDRRAGLDQVEQQLGESRNTLVDRDQLFELFDQLRDF